MKHDVKCQIIIAILCVLVAIAFVKTIDDIRLENAQVKNEWRPEWLEKSLEHEDVFAYKLLKDGQYRCMRCGGVSEDANIMASHNCISTTTGKRELVHEQEVEHVELDK